MRDDWVTIAFPDHKTGGTQEVTMRVCAWELAQDPPGDEATVLVYLPHADAEEAICLGYYDTSAEQWRLSDGMPLAGSHAPTHFMELPSAPIPGEFPQRIPPRCT